MTLWRVIKPPRPRHGGKAADCQNHGDDDQTCHWRGRDNDTQLPKEPNGLKLNEADKQIVNIIMEMVADQLTDKADPNKFTVIKARPHHIVKQGNINKMVATQDTANTKGTDTKGTANTQGPNTQGTADTQDSDHQAKQEEDMSLARDFRSKSKTMSNMTTAHYSKKLKQLMEMTNTQGIASNNTKTAGRTLKEHMAKEEDKKPLRPAQIPAQCLEQYEA